MENETDFSGWDIIICDPDKDVVYQVSCDASRLGFRMITICFDGLDLTKAISEADNPAKTIVISEVRLPPFYDGLEIMEETKKTSQRDMRFIFLTFRGRDEDYIRLLHFPFDVIDYYLIKPFDPVKLQNALTRIIQPTEETPEK
ncbi:MAG: hypothetical protein CEN91_189 [Candidatus Berkelbacteria bacterium Licking1014_85]|uniref:Response regulatory domain-containing protein n=1 Tax=Candidatus Berkelbacteria bacterium Licking1014_85 TaxID=2017148 RepID=A0A554LL72_9BACT|nr:MAG: hypothetical protein CEN91_189 [Candidatus Berkelbacteria bacterium Licking1014_85]